MSNKLITLLLILCVVVCPIRCAATGCSACCGENQLASCCQQGPSGSDSAELDDSRVPSCCCRNDQSESELLDAPVNDENERRNSKSKRCCQCICSGAIVDIENALPNAFQDLALGVPCRAEFSRVALTKSFLHGDQTIRPGQHYGRALRCLHASFLL